MGKKVVYVNKPFVMVKFEVCINIIVTPKAL